MAGILMIPCMPILRHGDRQHLHGRLERCELQPVFDRHREVGGQCRDPVGFSRDQCGGNEARQAQQRVFRRDRALDGFCAIRCAVCPVSEAVTTMCCAERNPAIRPRSRFLGWSWRTTLR